MTVNILKYCFSFPPPPPQKKLLLRTVLYFHGIAIFLLLKNDKYDQLIIDGRTYNFFINLYLPAFKFQ